MQALRDLLKPERITAIVDVGAAGLEGSPPYQRMLDEGLCTAVSPDLDDNQAFYDIDLLKITGRCDREGILRAGRDKVAVQTHVSFFPDYTFGAIDAELRALGFILHCFADSYVMSIVSATPVPHPDPHQIMQSDVLYVRDFSKPMAVEQWKQLALLAHHVAGSYDLAMHAVSQLAKGGAVAADAPAQYQRILETQ